MNSLMLEKIDKFAKSTLITVIKSDKNLDNEYFVNAFKLLNTNFDFKDFSIINIDELKNTVIKANEVLFFTNYIFNEENDLLIRSAFDSAENPKIFLIPCYDFDYKNVSTHLSGRIDICNLYFNSFSNQNTLYSFSDYLFIKNIDVFENERINRNLDSIIQKYSYRLNKEKLHGLLVFFATNIGKPLSISKIKNALADANNFIHNDVLGSLIDDLINLNILTPCKRIDLRRNIDVSTNIYYFFTNNAFLSLILKKINNDNIDISELMRLNGVFLELFYSSTKINMIKTATEGRNYIFALDGIENNSKIISYMENVNLDSLKVITNEMYKANLICEKLILTSDLSMSKTMFGINVEFIDNYFGAK